MAAAFLFMGFLDYFNPIGSVATGLFGGIASLIGAESANDTNMKLAEQNNKAQLNMMREQNEFNHQEALDQWNRQVAYNSPANQMKLLQQAGINPNGVNFSPNQITQAAPTASGLPSLSLAQVDAATMAASMSAPFLNVLPALKAQKEISKIAAETQHQKLTNDNFIVRNDLELENMRKGLLLSDVNILKGVQDIQRNAIDLKYLPQITQAQLDELQQKVIQAENANQTFEIVDMWSRELGFPVSPECLNTIVSYVCSSSERQEVFVKALQETTGITISKTTQDAQSNTSLNSQTIQNGINEGTSNTSTSDLRAQVGSELSAGIGLRSGGKGTGIGASVSSSIESGQSESSTSTSNRSKNETNGKSNSDTNSLTNSNSSLKSSSSSRSSSSTVSQKSLDFKFKLRSYDRHRIYNKHRKRYSD